MTETLVDQKALVAALIQKAAQEAMDLYAPSVSVDTPTRMLVIAAREAFEELSQIGTSTSLQKLDTALESFSARVAYENEPDENCIVPTCPRCGSPEVSVDATARWDIWSQSWSLSDTFESKYCGTCSYEGDTFHTTKLTELTAAQRLCIALSQDYVDPRDSLVRP